MPYRHITTSLIAAFFLFGARAQDQYELNTGWKCINIGKIAAGGGGTAKIGVGGEKISLPSWPTADWMPATVPGTVLTSLIGNRLAPDPFYGMNNEKIPDIYTTGRDHYTYWFVRDFKEPASKSGRQVWLHLRGVNYSCDVFLNGHQLNSKRHAGMFLRQTYNITALLAKDGSNRVAIIVYPPDPVGNPNGGQGGDGEIARNNTHQYVAGWDWIQPVRDRNTGIWDKVTIEHTGPVRIKNPHVITEVPGGRWPDAADQQPALLHVSAELENASTVAIGGILLYEIDKQVVGSKEVTLRPGEVREVQLGTDTLRHPRLWWPNGYGPQNLYHTELTFAEADTINIAENGKQLYRDIGSISLDFGVRQVTTSWNSTTRSRQAWVNGQPVFIKGGNWIVSDELLRFSPERYDAEVRFHRDMNLNLIRVWGGALTERPEFYEACDRYGLLVFQDFWNSGDCNGRWEDPKKKEDQWTRRKYPDDHGLFLASVTDQVKMLRNHPSLAFWCGGNEITPPEDIFTAMKDSILPALDGTRYLFDYSNSDSMSFNSLGGNGDGPYGVQPISRFWAERTFPFNSEVGSVGVGDYESLERFLPLENRVAPQAHGRQDSVWTYHKYISYDSTVYAYGPVKDLKDFSRKAQLVNYDQYRALMEGYSSHMWEWYTGSIIWKTQNPWTALRGQMYDYYLDVNACLYGLHCGSEPLHVMYDPVQDMVEIVNNTFGFHRNMMLEVKTYDMKGKEQLLTSVFEEIGPSTVRKYVDIGREIGKLRKKEGVFLSLRLLNDSSRPISENFYWLPDADGEYSGLQQMPKAQLGVQARQTGRGTIAVTLRNAAGNPVAFFCRLALTDPLTKKRILPVFFSDNYVSIPPGMSRTIMLEYRPAAAPAGAATVSAAARSTASSSDRAATPARTATPISNGKTVAGNSPVLVSVEGWNLEGAVYEIK